MNAQASRPRSPKSFRRSWLFFVVLPIIAYSYAQPIANERLGWNLPSLQSFFAGAEKKSELAENSRGSQDSTANDGIAASGANSSGAETGDRSRGASSQPGVGGLSSDAGLSDKSSSSDKTSGLKYGVLKTVGNEVYLSPAGLRYTPGSQEGHRLKHVERHLKDQPDRPGKHGVFYGDMPQVLRWIDEAFGNAKAGAKGTSKKSDDGRMVYEARFAKPIGFVGGRDGGKNNNPEAFELRLVVDGDRVITAFPY